MEPQRVPRTRPHALPLLWIALTVVALVPVWSQRLLPMLDTPNHLAMARAWHDFHDPASHVARFYTLHVRPAPYILFYASLHALMFVTSIEVANKLLLSAYLVAFPLSIRALVTSLGRSPWLALGAFPLAFNQAWIYGFTAHLVAVCLMFFALAALVRYLRDGARRELVALSSLALVLCLWHVLPWGVLGLCALALGVVHRREPRRVAAAALALAPSGALMAAMTYAARRDGGFVRDTEFVARWRDVPTLLTEFPRRVADLFPGSTDTLCLAAVGASVLGLCLTRGAFLAWRGEFERRQTLAILAAMLLAYVCLPWEIRHPVSWWYVSGRLPAMIAPVLLCLPALPPGDAARLWALPIVVAALVLPLNLSAVARDFDRRCAPFMRLVERIPRGAPTLVLARGMMRGSGSEEKSGDPATSGPAYWHFSAWPMALRGGCAPYLFDIGVPVRARRRLTAPDWFAPDRFELSHAPDFDYYLVRAPTDATLHEPRLTVTARDGDWVLFRRAP